MGVTTIRGRGRNHRNNKTSENYTIDICEVKVKGEGRRVLHEKYAVFIGCNAGIHSVGMLISQELSRKIKCVISFIIKVR